MSKPAAGKRANGEGAITYIESRGEWRGSIRDGLKPDGTPNRIYFSSGKGGKRSDVVKKMQEWRLAKQQGYAEDNKVTLEEGMNLWLETIKKTELKPASYDRLESIISAQVSPRIGDYDLKALTDVIIKQELLDPITAEGLSRSTLKKAYDAVHAYLKYAVYKDFISKDPMTMLKLPRQSTEIDAESLTEASQSEDEGAVEPLSDEEIKKLYSATSCVWKSTQERKFPLTPAYLFILNTGLRMGEALALHWSDIDWEHKLVSVTKNLILVKNRDAKSSSKYSLIIQNTPKSNKSRRTVPLNSDALKYLKELKCLRGTSLDGYVIHSKEGHPVYPRNFLNALDVICKAVGLRKITFHPLRHTYATKLFEAGVDIKIISELLGHSSTEITYRIYIHVIERIKREATSKAFDIMPK